MKTLSIVALCLLAVPALAAQPTVSQAPSDAAWQRSVLVASFPVLELSTCTADCTGGYSVTCSGNVCAAVNADCPDQAGFCWSDTEGTKDCVACPACGPLCNEVEGSFCVKDWTTKCYDPFLGCRHPLTCACHNGAYACP